MVLTILTLTLGYGAHHPCADSAPAGHEDSLVATLKRSRIATRRLGLDRMLAGKARSIAAMRWRGVALAQGTLGGGNMLPRTVTRKLAVRNAFESNAIERVTRESSVHMTGSLFTTSNL